VLWHTIRVLALGIGTGMATVVVSLGAGLLLGFWWGLVGGIAVLGAAFAVVPRLITKGEGYVCEAISLFLWAGKHSVEHADPSSSDGVFRGTALEFVRVYRGEWREYEVVSVLRELKNTGSGLARNPDTGKNFTVFLSREN